MDRISELPDNAIDNIIESLSLRDAVRTSILSRIWQYKWTTRSTLSLDSDFVYYSGYQNDPETFPSFVQAILLQHNGPLHKFKIDIPNLASPKSIATIALAIRVALMKGVQEFSLFTPSFLHVLPFFLFSSGEQLTELVLENCVFNPPIGFRGFSNLKTFYLFFSVGSSDSYCDSERLSSFISGCPKLQRIQLCGWYISNDLNLRTPSLEWCAIGATFRSIIFQEAPNLVSLVISENTRLIMETIPSNDYMLQFFSNMAKIEYLTLGGRFCHLLGTDCAPRKLSTILHNLKTFYADDVDLGRIRHFHFILCLMMSSPNLQHLIINIEENIDNLRDPNVQSGDYKDFCFQHLQSVRIAFLSGSKAEMKLIEILLGNSPALQNLSTEIDPDVNEECFSKELRQFHRASPTAQVSCIHVGCTDTSDEGSI